MLLQVVTGEDDDGCLGGRRIAADFSHGAPAVDARHAQVQHDEIGAARDGLHYCLTPIGRGLHRVAHRAKVGRVHLPSVEVVVGDEDERASWSRGRTRHE